MTRVLVTGAAGRIGGYLRARLAAPDRVLRLLDVAPIEADPAEEVVHASVTDLAAMEEACRDVDAVVHLGGIPNEDRWEHVLETNIDGTYRAIEAARRAGVPRFVFASSNHAVGFLDRESQAAAGGVAPDYAFPAPDTYYGVGKVLGEALASLYHSRYGMDTICLRILTCRDTPVTVRDLGTWLSPDDTGRLFEAALTAPSPGFRVVWGVSANTRAWFSMEEAAALGYHPLDDAEDYAEQVLATHAALPLDALELRFVGGPFTDPQFDAGYQRP